MPETKVNMTPIVEAVPGSLATAIKAAVAEGQDVSPVDPVEEICPSFEAEPDVNGYATVLRIAGVGRGKHVGSARLIAPGGHARIILMDLDFEGSEFTTSVRTELESASLRLLNVCEDFPCVMLPKPYDEGR